MNRTRHLSIAAVLVVVTTAVMYLLISGQFIGFGLLQLPAPAAEEAAIIDSLMQGHMILMAFLFAVIMAPASYAIIVFRRQEGDDEDAEHIHGNTTVEIIWTVVPIILVIIFAVWGVYAYTDVIASEEGERHVLAQGYKWDWNFYYPEYDNRFDSSLVVEVNQPVFIEMQSSDVIHAFWVPSFRVKQDVAPYNTSVAEFNFASGMYDREAAREAGYISQEIRFTPTKEGVYRLRCAEICGTNHYAMLAHVHVLSAADYQAWVAGELTLPSDPNQTNVQQRNADGTESEVFFLSELEEYCVSKYGSENCEIE